MRNAKNFSSRLIAMLLSTAMIFAPILESMPVYAAEAGMETERIGTQPEETFHETPSHEIPSHEIVRQTGTGDADDIKLFSALRGALFSASASDFSNVGGWNESIYAEIAGVTDADVTAVSWSGAMTGNLAGDDLTYLVRDNGNGGVRIDIPGLKAGTYTLTVKVGSSTLTKSNIEVYAYDRSGYAHFNYTEGVGAYNDDGTLKKNAIVLYVTDENKNTVSLSDGKTTVTGIGKILNNSSIFKNLAKAGKPLVVRFIGCVSETEFYERKPYDAKDAGKIDGLTDYVAGSDNGHMARIQSGKDITLEGIGYDAVIDGWGFHYVAKSDSPEYGKSFEVRNLTFINTPEDAIGMEGVQKTSNDVGSDLSASVERCWIHNNEFYCPEIINPAEDDKAEGDGSVDFKRGQYFTCSYNYFDGCHKTNLVGADKNSLQYNLTYHHNYWYMCKARGPLARNANIHMYNNIVEKQRDYFQNPRATSYIFSEYNLFYACSNPQDTTNAKDGNGVIKSYRDSIASVINMDNPAEVVENKTDYVANNCQFSARKIKYDKFDTDPSLSYIPGNNYKLDTDFTELRKVVASQTGVQKQNPKRPEKITAGEYSVVKGTTATKVDALPKNLTPGKVRQYAFTVNEAFDLEVAYKSADTAPGVLVNEAGENLLTGNGSLKGLSAGTYMIQAKNFQPWVPASGSTAEKAFSFKEITVNTLNITKTTAHVHEWVLDSSKSVAATCTAAGKNFYTCEADKDGQKCNETKEESVKALGHSWSGWTVDKPATETETGQRSRSCTKCDAKETETIPVIIQNISWDFAELNPTTDIKTIGGVKYYAELALSGNVSKNKDYLLAKEDATITIPNLKKGDKVIVKYCYEASFTLGETTVDAMSGTTDQIDKVEHIVTADGPLVIKNNSKGKLGKQTYFCAIEIVKAENLTPYTPVLSVGQDEAYKTIGDALAAVKKMTRTADQKVTIMIDPGNYEEMLVIDMPNVTLQNASATPSIGLKNRGVDIDENAVRVTWYYGHGYTYYSMDSNCKYDAGVLAANKSKGSASFVNPGAGTTNGSYWNATVIISADNFTAKDIIFENSFNQYVSAKSLEDVIEAQTGKEGAKEGTVKRADMKTLGDTKVQEKEYVERAAALAITNNTKEVYFNNCKFVGRQDTLYGGTGVTAGFEYCSIYGGTDYIFGGMTAVFKQCDLVFNTNDQTEQGLKNDVGYITAPQQAAGRGYLMYKCTVTSTVPGVDTASAHTSKPGYLGRPWKADTGEAVFYKTTIEKADSFWNKGSYSYGESLIRGAGWGDGLGGQSALCGEYGTIEEAGVDNSSKRASWSKVFKEEKLADGTPISIKGFLKDWEVPFDSDDSNVPVPKQYTITIDRQNGTDLVVKTVAEGTALTKTDLPTPTREGYHFTGWVDSSNKSVTLPYTPTANVTIKATWEKIIEIDPDVLYNKKLISLDIPTGTYTSDFQKNGFTITAGEGTDQSVSVDVGSEKTIGGTKYTGRLKTGGIGTKDYRSIKVTTEDAATLTMACVVATTGDECELGVATLNEKGEFVEITTGITVDGKAANKITLSGSKGNLVTVKLPAADTYYIYSKGSTLGGNNSGGVNFYAINVTYANGVDPAFCTVTFDSKGGLSVESQKVQAGYACMEPAEILKSGYTFDGWYADSECTQKYDFSAPVKSNLTLYAKWLAGEPDSEYLVLDMKDLPARDYKEVFKRNGFTFNAASDKNLSVDTSAVTVDGVNYTRRLKLNGTGDKDNRNISFTIEADATLTLVAASGKSGTGRALTVTNGTTTYDISNIDAAAKYTQKLTAGTWQIYAAGDGVNIYYISVKGESLKAQYVIAIDRQDGTEAVVKTVVEGTQLTETDLPATLTREGYTFQGWVDEEDNTITVPYTPTKSMIIKAKWKQDVVENQYTITIDKQDGTEPVEKVIVEGTELTETDLPANLTREGYTFLGWEDENGETITVPYTPTKSMTIKAKWQEVAGENQYTITIDKQDGTEPVEKVIEAGTELTETDLPSTLTKEGYTFQGWVDEEGEAITVPYTPTKSMTIRAKWQEVAGENQYVITIDKQDGTELVEKVIKAGTELTETDLPSTLTREGYIFQGWIDEEDNAITVPYMPTKSMTITAKWQSDSTQPGPGPNPGPDDPIDPDEVGLHVRLKNPDETYT
ncbi:MAG: InlB B-repeat-containing protein, partial [Acetatifactor sp.]|nr:InlB B-repeat-containing protein [Acetatifactor sp.]